MPPLVADVEQDPVALGLDLAALAALVGNDADARFQMRVEDQPLPAALSRRAQVLLGPRPRPGLALAELGTAADEGDRHAVAAGVPVELERRLDGRRAGGRDGGGEGG